MIGQTNKLVSKESRFFVRNLVPILGKINVNKHSLTTFLGFQEKGTTQIHSTALNREISFKNKFVQLCLRSLNFQCYSIFIKMMLLLENPLLSNKHLHWYSNRKTCDFRKIGICHLTLNMTVRFERIILHVSTAPRNFAKRRDIWYIIWNIKYELRLETLN